MATEIGVTPTGLTGGIAAILAGKREIYSTREEWLHAAAKIMAPWIEECEFGEIEGLSYPEHVRYACGFPYGRKSTNGEVIGQAWSREVSKDDGAETFISPVLSDPARICDVLLHEMCHHTLGIPEGHGKRFGALVRSLGMIGPKTATEASHDLRCRIMLEVLPKIGRYPHGEMELETYTTPTGRKKTVPKGFVPKAPGGNLLKVWCDGTGNDDGCGFNFRVTSKWNGYAVKMTCPCGGMLTDGYNHDDD